MTLAESSQLNATLYYRSLKSVYNNITAIKLMLKSSWLTLSLNVKGIKSIFVVGSIRDRMFLPQVLFVCTSGKEWGRGLKPWKTENLIN